MSALLLRLGSHKAWEGSLDELTVAATELIGTHPWQGQTLRPPSRSVVVDYRSAGLIAPAIRKRYQWAHLVQLVVACVLVQSGHSRKSAAKWMQSLDPAELIALLMQHNGPSSAEIVEPGIPTVDHARALGLAHEAVCLLAVGLVDHFQRARSGRLLVHDPGLSPALRGAMSRMASLHVMFGMPVRSDGAHTLVAQCRHTLRAREWGIPIFDSPDCRFHGIRLLDGQTCLPTIECIDLARQSGSEIDLNEQQAFAQLNSACDQFGMRGSDVYAKLREFITRHPISSPTEIRRFLSASSMQLAAPFLATCYESVQPHHLVNGALLRCATCGAPMANSVINGHACCAVRQCGAFDVPVLCRSARQVPVQDVLIAKSHILVYWCGPGQDEIALYDTATANPPGLVATLYPGRDKCDVSLDNETIGIDVKSHASPFLLADTLNRNVGGLELFPKKYIAINDQALSRFPGYLDILRRECNRTDIEFIAVSALRRKLRTRS
ncbi:hypothetical protein [Cupriavidus oxalaticus]|uniref:restriction endonuclease-related protein n=1 Tax=Cupriavidus oxalaticus TaxID=96344 RepID=UPI001244AADF|nr:hypothetical protein [Cupriavidus oxalaticus]